MPKAKDSYKAVVKDLVEAGVICTLCTGDRKAYVLHNADADLIIRRARALVRAERKQKHS